MTLVDPSKRDEVIAAIRKEYGDDTAMRGDEMPFVERIPTGSLGLDYITGGGIPIGRFSRFWGETHSCKTLAGWNIIRNAQNYGTIMNERYGYLAQVARLHGDHKLADYYKRKADELGTRWVDGMSCAYVNVEDTYDPEYVEKLGVNTHDIELINETRIEDIGAQVEKMLQAFHVILIDSCSQAVSVQELGADDGIYANNSYALDARQWKKMFNWWNDRKTPENVIIYITHSTTQIGMSANQRFQVEKPPGGKMMEYISAMTLRFTVGKQLRRRVDGSLIAPDSEETKGKQPTAFERGQPDGREIYIRCDKSKASRSERVAVLHYDKEAANFDPLHEYVKLAVYFHLLRRTGEKSSWYELPDGSKTQHPRQYVAENDPFQGAIEDMALRCAADPAYERQIVEGTVSSPVLDLVS